MDITIKTPVDFNFRRTVLSHGWCALPPFEFDKNTWALTRVLDRGHPRPVTVKISSQNVGLKVKPSRRLGKRATEEVVRDVRHMFRLDDDLRDFYQSMAAEPEFAKGPAGPRPVGSASPARISWESDYLWFRFPD